MQARDAETNGNYAAARSNARIALGCNIAAILGWVVFIILIIVIPVGVTLTAASAYIENECYYSYNYYYYYYYYYCYYYKWEATTPTNITTAKYMDINRC